MREGKERSRSRPREQPLGDVQMVAARRAAQRQMQMHAQAKRRASAGEEQVAGIVRLPVAMGVMASQAHGGAFVGGGGHPLQHGMSGMGGMGVGVGGGQGSGQGQGQQVHPHVMRG